MEDPRDALDLDFDGLEDLDLEIDASEDDLPFESINARDLTATRPRRSLDEVDLGGHELLDLQLSPDVTGEFTERFLLNVRKAYTETGRGDYTCVLKWYHRRVNDSDVDRFIRTVRARVSRLRQQLKRAERDFVVTLVYYEIMADNQHVLVTLARMSRELYLVYEAERQSARNAAKPSRAGRLLNLL